MLGGDVLSRHPLIDEYLNFKAIRNLHLSKVSVDGLMILGKQVPGERCSSTANTLESLLLVWGNETFTLSADSQYHTRIATAIISGLRCLKEENIPYPLSVKEKFLAGIPVYLGCTRAGIREMGLVVAQIASSLLSPEIKLALMEDTPSELQWIKKLSEQSIEESIHAVSAFDKTSLAKKDDAQMDTIPLLFQKQSITRQVPTYFPSRNVSDKTPKFIKQALLLLKSEDPHDIELGLKELEKLISKGSETETEECVDDVCEFVISFQNNYELPEFDLLVSNSMIALLLRQPEGTLRYSFSSPDIYPSQFSPRILMFFAK